MAASWDGKERRKHPRVPVKGEVRGKIHTVASAPILDISMTGALLEAPSALTPGVSYTFRLALSASQHLQTRARVVRSYVHGFDKNQKGETVIMYRVAIEFQGLPEPHRKALEQFIQQMEKKVNPRAELRRDRNR
ncbi:MAG: PilZ domain-containing protein [Acidobacteriota bacterium]